MNKKNLLTFLFCFVILACGNFVFAQTCEKGEVICPSGQVACCEKFKPHCKDGEAKCCKKKEDGSGLKCQDKDGNTYTPTCESSCNEADDEEDDETTEELKERTDEQSEESSEVELDSTLRAIVSSTIIKMTTLGKTCTFNSTCSSCVNGNYSSRYQVKPDKQCGPNEGACDPSNAILIGSSDPVFGNPTVCNNVSSAGWSCGADCLWHCSNATPPCDTKDPVNSCSQGTAVAGKCFKDNHCNSNYPVCDLNSSSSTKCTCIKDPTPPQPEPESCSGTPQSGSCTKNGVCKSPDTCLPISGVCRCATTCEGRSASNTTGCSGYLCIDPSKNCYPSSNPTLCGCDNPCGGQAGSCAGGCSTPGKQCLTRYNSTTQLYSCECSTPCGTNSPNGGCQKQLQCLYVDQIPKCVDSCTGNSCSGKGCTNENEVCTSVDAGCSCAPPAPAQPAATPPTTLPAPPGGTPTGGGSTLPKECGNVTSRVPVKCSNNPACITGTCKPTGDGSTPCTCQ